MRTENDILIDIAGVNSEIISVKNKKDAYTKEIEILDSELEILYEKKRAIEAEIKQYANSVREFCSATGKTHKEFKGV